MRIVRSYSLAVVALIASAVVCLMSGNTAAISGRKKGGAGVSATTSITNLRDLDYAVYPQRTEEEAAVLEWGHSAIISALDASVAHFGPQTSEAALLEVETQPILASPVSGVRDSDADALSKGEERSSLNLIRPLDNADEIDGNICVMTNVGGLSGLEMAKIAQVSGAASLLVVNIDEDRPDDIYRLPAEEGSDEIEIPVVMISLNSANVLTTATVTPDMKQSEIVNNGMPDRVRLYAGGDRPFFEDVEAGFPTVYLIHNLLTPEECDSFIKQADPLVAAPTKDDSLQLTHDIDKLHGIERVMLWQGQLHSPSRKQIEERIEQVTGFPSTHYSDFIVDRLTKGSYVKPRFDAFPNSLPMATITVFLSDDPDGGDIVFPSTDEGTPLQIRPRKGMAVVHHNTDDKHQLDVNTIHALLPVSAAAGGPFYVATKHVHQTPVSNARRIAVPAFAAPFGGKLPPPVTAVYEILEGQFGYEQGGVYFDKLCIFLPCLILFGLAQIIATEVHKKMTSSAQAPGAASSSSSSPSPPAASSSPPPQSTSSSSAKAKGNRRKKRD